MKKEAKLSNISPLHNPTKEYVDCKKQELEKFKVYVSMAKSNIQYFRELESDTQLGHIYRAKKEANSFWLQTMQSEVIELQKYLMDYDK